MPIRNLSFDRRPAAVLLVASTLIAGMNSALGAPLDFGLLALPGFTFDRDDSRCVLPGICTTYNASTNKFSVAGIPITFFPVSGGSQVVGMPSSLSINVLIDETGSPSSDPIPEPDMQLTGDISGISAVLLTGEILEFGFADPPGGTNFQFRFIVTGGSLQSDYAGSDIGLLLDMETLTGSVPFNGGFDSSFNGGTKGSLGRIQPLPENPNIRIEKSTNGIDADDPNAGDAPSIAPGALVTWEYFVTNEGDVPLVNVQVIDDQLQTIAIVPQFITGDTNNDSLLDIDEIWVYGATGPAEDLTTTTFTTTPGACENVTNVPLYENRGQVTAETQRGTPVQDEDLSHYCNPPQQAGACLIIIDEDSIDNDVKTIEAAAQACGVESDELVNDQSHPGGPAVPTEIGNPPLFWNELVAENRCTEAGRIVKLPTGEVDDEGWFALPPPPVIRYSDQSNNPNLDYDDWITRFAAGTLSQQNLDKVRDVMPLRNQDLVQLVGRTCVAVVYDSDLSINYNPLDANMQGERYGLFSFKVLGVEVPGSLDESQSSSSLYDLWVEVLPPQDPAAPFEAKIQDHEPDSIQITQAIYFNNQNRLVVNAESNFAGVDNTPPTPGDPNGNNAYMTLSVDGSDAGALLGVDPFILEGCDTARFPPSPAVTCSIPMTFDPGTNLYEFVLDNVGVNLDGRRLLISTDEGGSDNVFIE